MEKEEKQFTLKKFIPCRNCPSRINGIKPGYYYDTVDGFSVARECKCHRRWRREVELELTLHNSEVNTEHTFDDYKGTKSLTDLLCLKKIAENPDKFLYNRMVYVYGANGTQKTTMCQVLAKELILKGYSVQYILMYNLIDALIQKEKYGISEDEKDRLELLINKCAECDFLIIDEAFDFKKIVIYNSGYQIPYLDNFLRLRFDVNKKFIMFISNKLPSQIADVPISRNGEQVREGIGISLQNFIERNVGQALLTFEDVWADNANQLSKEAIFGL